MAKTVPLQHGCCYHIYNRGNNRENLFLEARNYPYFLQLYARHIEPVADTYAYCLLRNHFHVLVRIKTLAEQEEHHRRTHRITSGTGEPFKVKHASHQFGNLFNAYTKAINKAYQRTGSLFEGQFERIEVTSQDYLMQLVTYIHRNPQAHGMIDDFRDWPYSSYQSLVSTKPTRLRRSEVISWYGSLAQAEAAHQLSSDVHPLPSLLSEEFDEISNPAGLNSTDLSSAYQP